MAIREFRDAGGVTWQVWAVARPIATAPAEGWLTFESKFEKRRLRPIPAEWEHRSELELRDLLDAALPTPSPRRLID